MERPILFSGPMVRAILAGTKTQTRRVVKPQPAGWSPVMEAGGEVWAWCVAGDMDYSERLRCPYGAPGDRLWVRETWNAMNTRGAFWDELNAGERAGWRWLPLYKASETAGEWGHYEGPYRPSIHMPRQFSRITLEVVSVRVERVQDISEADAQAEGVDHIPQAPAALNHRTAFAGLWDQINARRGYGWQSNPWVWVVEFKAVSDA